MGFKFYQRQHVSYESFYISNHVKSSTKYYFVNSWRKSGWRISLNAIRLCMEMTENFDISIILFSQKLPFLLDIFQSRFHFTISFYFNFSLSLKQNFNKHFQRDLRKTFHFPPTFFKLQTSNSLILAKPATGSKNSLTSRFVYNYSNFSTSF